MAKVGTLKFGSLNVEVCQNPAEMGEKVAVQVAEALKSALETKETANIILATGNSMLAFMAALSKIQGIPWQRVNIFHMDEYLGMADTHPASFRRYIQKNIVDHVSPKAYYGIVGDAWDASAECRRYEKLLVDNPADICCLGIGEHGHLAFNDPPVADFSDPVRVKIVALDRACRMQQVGEGHFPTLEATPSHAITLTIPALLAAKKVFAIVPEMRKAVAVKRALTGAVDTSCPSSILQKTAHAQLYLDVDSASGL